MGKRSEFQRVERDYYRTFDPKASASLEPHIQAGQSYVELCAGDGSLIKNLNSIGLACRWASDKAPQDINIIKVDALDLKGFGFGFDWIITNPPWDRKILHPMIEKFSQLRPTWLLFDAGWMFTGQAAPYLDRCAKIVTIGRLKWIEGTTMSGKDDCCWYLFDKNHSGGPQFFGKRP